MPGNMKGTLNTMVAFAVSRISAEASLRAQVVSQSMILKCWQDWSVVILMFSKLLAFWCILPINGLLSWFFLQSRQTSSGNFDLFVKKIWIPQTYLYVFCTLVFPHTIRRGVSSTLKLQSLFEWITHLLKVETPLATEFVNSKISIWDSALILQEEGRMNCEAVLSWWGNDITRCIFPMCGHEVDFGLGLKWIITQILLVI